MYAAETRRSLLQHLCRIALLFFCLSNKLVVAQDAPKLVTIKLPDDSEMRFHAVYLSIEASNQAGSRKITLGSYSANHNYKEQLVRTSLGGGFIGKRECGKQRGDCNAWETTRFDWLYYLGETEVQRSQWDSVLRWMDQQDRRAVPRENCSQHNNHSSLPVTGVTLAEIARFIEALNVWILQRQSDRLPTLHSARAFCRLPTEAEWEFAARGGVEEKDTEIFKSPHPYGDDLGKYEWHRNNSNGEIRACGSRNLQPNKIGLRDMLGNVEELTGSLFSTDYLQGRFGHQVVRGNSCFDAPNDFSVSHRTEYAPYDEHGNLRRDQKIGFRLALSTFVSASAPCVRPEEVWRTYDQLNHSSTIQQ